MGEQNSNPIYTICFDCAKKYDAIWPKGHLATCWTGECDVCHGTKGVCDVSDWDWPRGKKPSTFSIMRRD
jgi:hypothetical protein